MNAATYYYIYMGQCAWFNHQKSAHICGLQNWLARQSKRTAGAGPCGVAARLNLEGVGSVSHNVVGQEGGAGECGEAGLLAPSGGIARRGGSMRHLLVLRVRRADSVTLKAESVARRC